MAKFNSVTARDAGLKSQSARRGDGKPDTGNDGTAFVDPVASAAAAGEPNEPGGRAKRRDAPGGSPAGAGAAKSAGKTQSASLDLSTAIGVIQGFHAVVGAARGEAHWFVNDADARRYGQAMANAARHFPLRTTQKAIDISMLIICAASIETPRIALSIQRARAPKGQGQRGPAQVFQFVPNPANAPPPPATAPPPPTPVTGLGGAGVGSPPIAEGPHDLSSDLDAIGGEPAA